MSETVSVIIPSFNRAYLIERAIKSVLEQTFRCSEIIVIDDGSTDNTPEVVNFIKQAAIRYVRHPSNLGLAEARNSGLKESKCDFIAFLDSDDFWYKDKISKQMSVFRQTDADFVFTNGYYKKESELLFETDKKSGFIKQRENHFPLKDIVSLPSSWLFKKEVLNSVDSFDKGLPRWEDGDFFVRAARLYKVYFLNEPLVFWQSPQENFNAHRELKCREIFFEKHKDDMCLDKDYYVRFLMTMGKDYLRLGERKKAREFFRRSLKANPFFISSWSKLLKTFL